MMGRYGNLFDVLRLVERLPDALNRFGGIYGIEPKSPLTLAVAEVVEEWMAAGVVRRPIADAPEGVVVLIQDPDEGVCTARMEVIRGKQFWMPHPASAESDSLRPKWWAPCPAFEDGDAP